MPNDIEIKTRHGLILEGVTAHALKSAGIKFSEQPSYSGDCEVPDFAIPDDDAPAYVLEVHQTDRRNSFQMKILRAFTAVAEAKAHWGKNIVSVNILFGDADPNEDREVPASNVRAMFGYFDQNILPRKAKGAETAMLQLEQRALYYASNEEDGKKNAVAKGVKELVAELPKEIKVLGDLLKSAMENAQVKEHLFPLWDAEASRLSLLGSPPSAGHDTFYKRSMVKAMYLTDADFIELYEKKDPNLCGDSLKKQILATKLAERMEGLSADGSDDEYTLDSLFEGYINDEDFGRLRQLCQDKMFSEPAMKWFFEDIRSGDRREDMASKFVALYDAGDDAIREALLKNIREDKVLGIDHPHRCWIADLIARHMDVSHNRMNNELSERGFDSQSLGNPFNQLSYKSERFLSDPSTHIGYVDGIIEILNDIAPTAGLAASSSELADRLLSLRLVGAVRLQKLNPLHLILAGVCDDLGLQIAYGGIKSILSDLSNPKDPVGNYVLFEITDGKKKVLAHTLSTQDSDGDHKSKEWGARRTALLYRLIDGELKKADYDGSILVLDGEWNDKDVKRLHRSGWEKILRNRDLERVLTDIYSL